MHTRSYITKSGFMKGEQCDLAFYYWWNKTAEINTEAIQFRMDQGTAIGRLAQQLASGGSDLNDLQLPPWELAAPTKSLMKKRLPIYEATFITEIKPKLLCKVDMLVPDVKKGWEIWEVKSSGSVKEEHIIDLAFQTYVAEACGVKVSGIKLVHLNTDYVRNGNLDIQQLFQKEDVTKKVRNALTGLGDKIKDLYKTGKLKIAPQIPIGSHCFTPYACAYQQICWKAFPPENHIYMIPRLRNANELILAGIYSIKDIDPETLSDKQRLVQEAHIKQTIIMDPHSISNFFSDKVYPYYFFDFETIMPAVPIWDGTRPYMQVPFQYSLHVIREIGAEPEHYEFLDDANGADPRRPLVEQLIKDIGDNGTVWAYNKSFELARLRELADVFKEHRNKLFTIIERLEDLITPFREQWYYNPAMRGSNSIKNVLPVLVPELSYDALEIGSGGEAMDVFLKLVTGDKDAMMNKEQILNDLRKYCKLDTMAMVKIFLKLTE